MLELGIPVRMLASLTRLAIGLQAVAQFVQQPAFPTDGTPDGPDAPVPQPVYGRFCMSSAVVTLGLRASPVLLAVRDPPASWDPCSLFSCVRRLCAGSVLHFLLPPAVP